MIVSIWVFFMLGEPSETAHGTPYVQASTPAFVHDTKHAREALEETMAERFHHDFPGVAVVESGWRRQEVKVMGDG
jgi:hypothetical protein